MIFFFRIMDHLSISLECTQILSRKINRNYTLELRKHVVIIISLTRKTLYYLAWCELDELILYLLLGHQAVWEIISIAKDNVYLLMRKFMVVCKNSRAAMIRLSFPILKPQPNQLLYLVSAVALPFCFMLFYILQCKFILWVIFLFTVYFLSFKFIY